MIEVVIRVRYQPSMDPDAYPDCTTEADAAAFDSDFFASGALPVEEIPAWAEREGDIDVSFHALTNEPPQIQQGS